MERQTGEGRVRTYPRKHKEAWEDLGTLDPLWAILSIPDRKFGRWSIDAFFETGVREVEELLQTAARLGHPSGRERVLDFGCGVGRVSRALSQHFQKCYGVDISLNMVRQAEELNRRLPNCEFFVNESHTLDMFNSGYFDLVYANLVLMHLPGITMIKSYLAEFLRVLKRGGLLVFQLPSHVPLRHRLDPRRKLYGFLRRFGIGAGLLYRRLRLVPITMRSAPRGEIVAWLRSHDARILEIQSERDPSTGIENNTYFVTR